MKRRAFIGLLGGAVASPAFWPLTAAAQAGDRVRRIPALLSRADEVIE